MSILLSRKAIIPVWLAVTAAVFVLFGPPLTSAIGWSLLLFVAVAPPTIVLVLTREAPLSVAEVMRQTNASRTRG